MQKILMQIGIKTKNDKNKLKIFGQGLIDASKKIFVPNLGDHRICMASFVLAILTGAKTKIKILKQLIHLPHPFLK